MAGARVSDLGHMGENPSRFALRRKVLARRQRRVEIARFEWSPLGSDFNVAIAQVGR